MNKYKDIINLPPHVSKTRKPMSLYNRAAQFAPFAALTGYGDAIKETSRLTEQRIELSDEAKEIINNKIKKIKKEINSNPQVTIKYFVPDNKKSGGIYKEFTGQVKKINIDNKTIVLFDKIIIPFESIIDIN